MKLKQIKNYICYVLMLTINVMTMQSLMVNTAAAAPACAAYSANNPSEQCTTVKVGSTVISAPRVTWTLVSENILDIAERPLGSVEGNRNKLTGNTSAETSGLTSAQVASVVNAFPSNVPMVVGRYEPISQTLRVDIFKIERTTRNGKAVSALYHSAFDPAYGEHWRAMGTYLSPAARQAGNVVGANPFTPFKRSGSENFHEVSLNGSMVVLGHAQRLVGAPVSLLINHFPESKSWTKKSGNIFRKKVTTYVDFSAKPEYYLGAPMKLQGGRQISLCTNSPDATSCYDYEAASSGVGFMKLEGGNIIDTPTFVHQWSETKKGWTLLAVFVFAFVFSFAAAAIAPMLSTVAATGAATAAPTLGAGFWTNMLSMTGVGGTTAVSAALIEAGLYTAATAAAGSGFGGMYGGTGNMVYSQEKASTPSKDPGHDSARQYRDKLLSNGTISGSVDSSLAPVRNQLLGNCGPGVLLKHCGGASGVLPRGDGYTDFDGIEFMRDNGAPKPAGAF